MPNQAHRRPWQGLVRWVSVCGGVADGQGRGRVEERSCAALGMGSESNCACVYELNASRAQI